MAAIAHPSFRRPERFDTVASVGTQKAGLFTAHRLTTTITLLATASSAGGLFLPHLYRDNDLVVSAWKAPTP